MVGNGDILSVITSKQKTVSMYCITMMKITVKKLKTVIPIFSKNWWNRDVRDLWILALWLANQPYAKKTILCRFLCDIQYQLTKEARCHILWHRISDWTTRDDVSDDVSTRLCGWNTNNCYCQFLHLAWNFLIGRFVTTSVPSFLHKSRYKLKLEAYVADLIPISDISRLQALWLAKIGFREKIGRIITAFVAIYLGKSYFLNLITFNPGVKTAHKPIFIQS